jgi:hypothetical protein
MRKVLRITAFGLLAVSPLMGCGGRAVATAQAIELPHSSEPELSAILRAHAARQRMFFTDYSAWPQSGSDPVTVSLVLYRPIAGKEWPEVTVDEAGHPGIPWVEFVDSWVPQETVAARASRASIVAELRARWPNLREVPVLPDGGLPLRDDLRFTPNGYKVAALAAPNYGLAPNSPLVAR